MAAPVIRSSSSSSTQRKQESRKDFYRILLVFGFRCLAEETHQSPFRSERVARLNENTDKEADISNMKSYISEFLKSSS